MNCCRHSTKAKSCRRSDGKTFSLPRRFTRKRCKQGVRGFSMRSSCAPYKGCGGNRNSEAVAVLAGPVEGVVHFSQRRGRCVVTYDITGLADGLHGFHVHECGDMTEGCTSGCAHFNPDGVAHGGREASVRHAGDLGNIRSSNGRARGTLTVGGLSTDPKSDRSIIGRMIIVHADKDDLGKGGDEESMKTGNAGKRLACGVIGIAKKR